MPLVFAIPLADMVVPLALLLLSLAISYLLVKPLTWALQQIPAIGGLAVGAVAKMGTTASGWAVGWLDGAAGHLLGLASGVVQNAYGVLSSMVAAVEWLAVHAASMAAAVAAVPDQVLSSRQAAEQYADQAVAHAEQLAASGVLGAERAAAAAVTAALVHAAAYTDARVADAERVAATGVADAVKVAEQVKAADQAALTAAVHTLEGTIATDLGAIRSEVGDLSGVLAGLGVASLAAEVTGLATKVAEIPVDCIGNLCNPSSPLQGILGSLLTDAELALVVAFTANAIRDPKGTAGLVNDARSVLVPLVSELASPFGVAVH